MIIHRKNWAAVLTFMFFGMGMIGAAHSQDEAADTQRVKDALRKLSPNLEVESIKPLSLPPLYEVVVGADVFYVTKDGQYLLQGDLIDLIRKTNLTEDVRTKGRLRVIQGIDPATMITFAPKDVKHTVTIFTDIDCGYCRKLHSEIAEYNKLGIAVRYVAFPRAGEGSESFYKAEAVWCAKDRGAALTAAKAGQKVPAAAKDCKNPVKQHLSLARELSLGGTPTLFLEDGAMVPGYLPAQRLLDALEETGKGS